MLRVIILVFVVATVSAAPLKITLSTRTGLQFDKPRFAVEPGQEVLLTFKNVDEMAHNLVIVAPGKRLEVVLASITLPPETGYIPKSDAVLWHTPVLKPDETAELKFTAPKTKGVYPYVCTFPGHGLLMYGAMYVGVKFPALAKDENVSPMARAIGSNKNHVPDLHAGCLAGRHCGGPPPRRIVLLGRRPMPPALRVDWRLH